ncbi:U3 small nucleolar RNA-associated protein 6 [Nematocida displodere]|uniref:U3 small nucleolar RNA-associated protein 6 n=1 Tax=Nematocida displodere TaxID=1805483 RepID=A0A177EGD3_9MICR|nr:U3 small nucleolar RNA-associated protein 6 [Nematocida displodere]
MSDQIRQEMEYMVAELQYYTKQKLFAPKEVTSIVKKRRDFEDIIQHTEASLFSFLKYIEYEILLERVFDKRAKKAGKRKPRDYIRRRINRLFKRTEKKFPMEETLHLTHLGYFLAIADKEMACKLALNLPRKIAGSSKIWIRCAEALRECEEIEASRTLLQRALRLVTPQKEVIQAFISIEESFPDEDSEQLISLLKNQLSQAATAP